MDIEWNTIQIQSKYIMEDEDQSEMTIHYLNVHYSA